MPFCRECGKEVEHDWVTCPYCSQTIGPPDLNFQTVQDSVIMGDVNTNINDSASISAAMKTTLKCPKCHSTGAILIGCGECAEHVGCSLCIDDIVFVRRWQVTDHSDDIKWYFEYFQKVMEKYPRSDLYKKYCQPCWDSEKEEILANELEYCSELKQKIIANRKESLVNVYNFTKRDVEALSSSEDEILKLESDNQGLFESRVKRMATQARTHRKRMGLKKEYGYTDEYITENLQLIMTELEWASYLSTLAPLHGYKGRSPQRLEALKKRARSKTNKNSKIGRIKKSDIKHNKKKNDD